MTSLQIRVNNEAPSITTSAVLNFAKFISITINSKITAYSAMQDAIFGTVAFLKVTCFSFFLL